MTKRSTSRLYCLRHFHTAKALPGQRDIDRQLDERGHQQAKTIGAQIHARGYEFSTILVSPSARTRQTVEGIGIASTDPRLRIVDSIYEAESEVYFSLLRAGLADGAMLVGHNPGMEEFLAALCRDPQDRPSPLAGGLPTGGLAVIDLPAAGEPAGPGSGMLASLVLP